MTSYPVALTMIKLMMMSIFIIKIDNISVQNYPNIKII